MRLTPIRARAILPLVMASALILAACAPAGSGGPAASSGGTITITLSATDAGDALAGEGGLTLYTLTNDVGGTSTCTSGGCATTWPALKGDGSQVQAGTGVSGTFGTTTWPDGTKQVTHNGQPLYYFSGDGAPGDANGEGSGGVWFIAPVGGAAGAEGSPTPVAAPYRQPTY